MSDRQEIYEERRKLIMDRIRQHSKRLANGHLIFYRCLASDYYRLSRLEKEFSDLVINSPN